MQVRVQGGCSDISKPYTLHPVLVRSLAPGGDQPAARGLSGVRGEIRGQRLAYHVRKRATFREGDLAERLVLSRLDRSEQRHRGREPLLSHPLAAAVRAHPCCCFSLHP